MGVLGVGMGLIVSQLGNVVQSAVGDADRSEAGGLQNTAQQLGSSLGHGAARRGRDHRPDRRLLRQRRRRPTRPGRREAAGRDPAGRSGSFVSSDQVRAGAARAGVDSETVDALVEDYEDAQLNALKTAFLFAAFIVLASFWATRRLPTRRFDELQSGPDPPEATALVPQ